MRTRSRKPGQWAGIEATDTGKLRQLIRLIGNVNIMCGK